MLRLQVLRKDVFSLGEGKARPDLEPNDAKSTQG